MSINRMMGTAPIVLPADSAIRGSTGTFSPTFSGSANPVGSVIQGLDDLKNWNNVQLLSGNLVGTAVNFATSKYDDNVQFYQGSYGYDQQAVGTIFRSGNGAGSNSQEVELLLCANVTQYWCAMYEMMIAVHPTNIYASMVRWNGPLATGGDQSGFTELQHITASVPTVANGDQLKATKVGNILSLYLNHSGGGFVQLGSSFDLTTSAANPYGPQYYTSGLVGAGLWQNAGTLPQVLEFGWSAITYTAP